MKIGEFIACAFIHLSRDQRCRKLPIQGDNISQTLHVPSLLVVKRVALTLSRFSCFWGFAFVWLTPFTLTVLCVSTRVTGLLDFHRVGHCVLQLWGQKR